MRFQSLSTFISYLKVVLGLLICALPAFAQQESPGRGTYPQGAYSLSDIEQINTTNGNVMFHVPVGSLPAGRNGLRAAAALHYNSKLYDSWTGIACGINGNTGEYECTEAEQLYTSPEGGWRYGFEYKLQLYTRPQSYPCSDPRAYYNFKLVMSFPDGSVHEFRPYGYDDFASEGWYQVTPSGYGMNSNCAWALFTSNTMTYYSTDNTHLRLEVQHDTNDGFENNPWTLFSPDGGRITFNEPGTNGQRIYDSNTNYVEVQNVILQNGNPANKIVDQLNRSLTIEHTSTGTDYVRSPGANGQTISWTITHKAINSWATNNSYYSLGANGSYFDFALPWMSGVDQVIFPTQAGGYAYTFNYNIDIALSLIEGFGEVKSITLPSADQNKAQATYLYYPYGYANADEVLHNPVTKKSLKYLKQYDSPTTYDNAANYLTETWTYNIPTHVGGAASTITSPAGGIVTEWAFGTTTNPVDAWKTGLVYKTEQPNSTVVERIWQACRSIRVSRTNATPASRVGRRSSTSVR